LKVENVELQISFAAAFGGADWQISFAAAFGGADWQISFAAAFGGADCGLASLLPSAVRIGRFQITNWIEPEY
jgi:hypothetical protein